MRGRNHYHDSARSDLKGAGPVYCSRVIEPEFLSGFLKNSASFLLCYRTMSFILQTEHSTTLVMITDETFEY